MWNREKYSGRVSRASRVFLAPICNIEEAVGHRLYPDRLNSN